MQRIESFVVFMYSKGCGVDRVNKVWGTVKDSPHDIVRACPKVSVLTRQHRLQSDVAVGWFASLQIIKDCTMSSLKIPNNLQDDVATLTRN